jgi:hypothetical protein
MKFLIQHNLMNAQQLEKIKTAVARFPHEFVGVIPFSHDITSENPIEGTDYIPYGSTLFTTLALERKWSGLYFDLENFSIERAIKHRGQDMMNRPIIVTANAAKNYLRKMPQEEIFIRPDLDLKHFSGQVIDSIECADWLEDAMSLPPESGSYAIDPEMLVCISTPKKIKAEWRYFIVGGKVVSGSMYRCHGQMKQEKVIESDVIYEAQGFADGWMPNKTCVMDLALYECPSTGLDKVGIIEFNCINSSGFYDNDVDAVFAALWEYAK